MKKMFLLGKVVAIALLFVITIPSMLMAADCGDSYDSEFGCPGDYDRAVAEQANSQSNVDKKSIVGDSSFNSKLRSGDVTFNDIPAMIVYATEFFLAIAGTVSIVAIIYGAVKMQIHSDAFGGHNNEEGKKTVIAGITGFAISISAWFLIKKFVEVVAGL